MSIAIVEENIRKINEEKDYLQPQCDSGNFSACSRIEGTLNSAGWVEGRKLAVLKKDKALKDKALKDKSRIAKIETDRLEKIANEIEKERLQEIKNQEITFNEQTNSGDFNETPITDVNLNVGCSECSDPVEKELPNNNMKFVGIAAIGVIALLVVRK
tara:strand:+ start:210 stop:683 length:474 start_codon:yes stop_codon:yes gene_type:complete